MANIVKLTEKHYQPLWEHQKRISYESGFDGQVIFSPFDEPFDQPFEQFIANKSLALNKKCTETNWMRSWIIVENNKVYGEICLKHCIGIKSTLHRAILMIGIEKSHCGQGFGTQLMQAALNWAKKQDSIEWLDLNVFSQNPAALKLYHSFGFTVIGTTLDQFRIHGQSIDDISMSLKL
ncbi:MAG: N-acetyltransferase family protein [bacterium]